MRRCAFVVTLLVSWACRAEGGLSQDPLSSAWPEWQRIEAGEPPDAWRLEEASFAFDAWEASVVVSRLALDATATTIRFEDAGGNALDVRLAPFVSRGPSGGLDPTLAEGDAVRMLLIRRQGFEGVATGLALRGDDDSLLLLYDDGGYGPAFEQDGSRDRISITRTLRGPNTGREWESRAVTFELDGETAIVREGESARLGATESAVSVVISREWTGPPPTDVDITPLAYLIYRVR